MASSRASVYAVGLIAITAALGAAAPGAPEPDGTAAAEAAFAARLLEASPGDVLRLAAARAALLSDGPLDASAEGDALRAVAEGAAFPALLAAPLSRLLAATADAADAVAAVLAPLDAADRAFLLANAHLIGTIAPERLTQTDVALQGAGPDAERIARVTAIAAGLDVSPMAVAAAALADAVEDALPALREAALLLDHATVPDSHACDVVNVPPFVCVRGTAADTWDTDFWVNVDLGGDDTYRNNAGAAGIAASGNGLLASVLVDVAGDDTYDRALTATTTSLVSLGHGAGLTGIGVLVDAAGADTYVARATVAPPALTSPAPFATTVAQGAAILGAGILVDTVGPNTFTATASTLGGIANVVAQGAATTGVGVLIGGAETQGSTTYDADSSSGVLLIAQTPNSRTYSLGAATTQAQGGGLLGAGVLVDAAGDESYSAVSSGGSATRTIAQGAALLGAGFLADGTGADDLVAHAIGDPEFILDLTIICPSGFICGGSASVDVNIGSADTFAHGAAAGGVGVLADLGPGANTHDAAAIVAPLGRAVVRFGGGGGTAGAFHALADVTAGDARVWGDGVADVAAIGVLVGGTDRDVHSLKATSHATAVANTVGGGTGSTRTATATAGDAFGLGQGFGAAGSGTLLEPAGDDDYVVVGSSTATATRNGAPGTTFVGTVSWAGRGDATATGAGVLFDAGGADTYGPTPSGLPGGNGTCWTNAPPGLPGTIDSSIGVGIDVAGTSLLSAPCFPPPPPN